MAAFVAPAATPHYIVREKMVTVTVMAMVMVMVMVIVMVMVMAMVMVMVIVMVIVVMVMVMVKANHGSADCTKACYYEEHGATQRCRQGKSLSHIVDDISK